jgi:hypothetical protein
MFKKKKENKMVWLVIEKLNYSTGSESFRVAKKAYSLTEAVEFKSALEKLSDDVDQSYFIATEIESGFNEVIKLHNQSVEDGSYYERHPEVKRPEVK